MKSRFDWMGAALLTSLVIFSVILGMLGGIAWRNESVRADTINSILLIRESPGLTRISILSGPNHYEIGIHSDGKVESCVTKPPAPRVCK